MTKIILLDKRYFSKANLKKFMRLADMHTSLILIKFPKTDYSMVKIINI